MSDYLRIIKRNFLSPIVISIVILGLILLYLGEKKDAYFVTFVVLVNSFIGIIQEIRAKIALKKLELLNAQKARRLANNSKDVFDLIDTDQVQIKDRLLLLTGDEIPVDGELLSSSGLEVNESMLTGESVAVKKKIHDQVFASTIVTAGSGILITEAVKDDTRAGFYSKKLKNYSPELTPIQKSIWLAITGLTYLALGLTILIYISYSLNEINSVVILKTIITAATAVVPEGLLLASTLLLAFGSLKLAQIKVLPQTLSSIETLPLIQTICTDKTGTLTEDKITLKEIKILDKSYSRTKINQILNILVTETSGGNLTGNAIKEATNNSKIDYKVLDILPFKSAKKYAGISYESKSDNTNALLGAPEVLTDNGEIIDIAKNLQVGGLRVLLLSLSSSLKEESIKKATPIALVVLENKLRSGLINTVKYLKAKNIDIRIISGDNPNTVSYIAKVSGISKDPKYITGSELSKLDDKSFYDTVLNTTIFARVLPEQKERIIKVFQDNNKYTAMVGDGINDSLAIKKADVGIAMFAGSTITKKVSDLILLNNDFNALPYGINLGSRLIRSIELIAALFFHKIIYGVVLLLITLIFAELYPFAPRHVTFLNIIFVTLPTSMYVLFLPTPIYKVNPKRFWRNTILHVIPLGIITGIALATSYLLLLSISPDKHESISTLIVILAAVFGIVQVLIGPMLQPIKRTKLWFLGLFYYLSGVILVVILGFGIGALRDFFDFANPFIIDKNYIALIIVTIAIILEFLIARRIEKWQKSNNDKLV